MLYCDHVIFPHLSFCLESFHISQSKPESCCKTGVVFGVWVTLCSGFVAALQRLPRVHGVHEPRSSCAAGP